MAGRLPKVFSTSEVELLRLGRRQVPPERVATEGDVGEGVSLRRRERRGMWRGLRNKLRERVSLERAGEGDAHVGLRRTLVRVVVRTLPLLRPPLRCYEH